MESYDIASCDVQQFLGVYGSPSCKTDDDKERHGVTKKRDRADELGSGGSSATNRRR